MHFWVFNNGKYYKDDLIYRGDLLTSEFAARLHGRGVNNIQWQDVEIEKYQPLGWRDNQRRQPLTEGPNGDRQNAKGFELWCCHIAW